MKNDPSGMQSESKGTKSEGEKSKETSGATYQWSSGGNTSSTYSIGSTENVNVSKTGTVNKAKSTTTKPTSSVNASAATSNIKPQEASSWPIVIATVASSIANNPGTTVHLPSIPATATAAAEAETAAATAESIGVNVAKETAVKVTQETTVNVVGESFFAIARTVSLTTVAVFTPMSCGTGDMPYSIPPDFGDKIEEKYGPKETFYRAMSWAEYDKRLGYLEQRTNSDGSLFGEVPYVTNSLVYATKALYEFSKSNEYDLIVAYILPKGTFDRLKSISLSRHTKDWQAAQLGLPIMKKESDGVNNNNINIKFPGKTADIHFNPYVIGLPIPLFIKNFR